MKKTYILALLLMVFLAPVKLFAQDGYIGEIKMFAGNFAPRNWAFCDGAILPIQSNQALFAILGTTYGGNGITTFALPDMRGRVPIHCGNSQGPGLTPRILGEQAGAESVSLNITNLPAHSHNINASTAAGTTSNPSGAFPANTGSLDKEYGSSANVIMNPTAVAPVGNNIPVPIMQPYSGVNFIICLTGIFPPRD